MMAVSSERLLRLTWIGGAACTVLMAVVPVIVLIGWRVGNHTMTSIVPGLVAMNPLTAVCFLACAAALGLLRGDAGRAGGALAGALGLAVGGCGALRLVAYFLGWDLSLDRVIFHALLDRGPGPPNRMAPNT